MRRSPRILYSAAGTIMLSTTHSSNPHGTMNKPVRSCSAANPLIHQWRSHPWSLQMWTAGTIPRLNNGVGYQPEDSVEVPTEELAARLAAFGEASMGTITQRPPSVESGRMPHPWLASEAPLTFRESDFDASVVDHPIVGEGSLSSTVSTEVHEDHSHWMTSTREDSMAELFAGTVQRNTVAANPKFTPAGKLQGARSPHTMLHRSFAEHTLLRFRCSPSPQYRGPCRNLASSGVVPHRLGCV